MDESRYGTAAGEWLMRDPRCRVAGPLSKRNKGQKKKKRAATGEMSATISSKHCSLYR